MRWLSDEAVERLRAQAEAPDLSGTRYRLVKLLGRGGMGSVYLAEDTALGRRVALKVLDVPDPGGELAARLLREARILAQLEHPGIVPVHDVGTLADGRVFYTMKYVEGRRLDRLVPFQLTEQSTGPSGPAPGSSPEKDRTALGGQPPSIPDRLRIFERICQAVAFAHARGVIHRDLKPQNIMVGPFGEVLVMDWGIAKILRATAASLENQDSGAEQVSAGAAASGAKAPGGAGTAHGTVLGTPGYMPPEQARGETERHDERADVYALGAILRFLLEARASDQGTTVSHSGAGGRPSASPGRESGSLPRPLAAVCAKAMAEDPAARYASAQELAADAARYLDGVPVSAYPETLLEKAGRFLSRHRVWVILLLTYLVVRILLLFWQRG